MSECGSGAKGGGTKQWRGGRARRCLPWFEESCTFVVVRGHEGEGGNEERRGQTS